MIKLNELEIKVISLVDSTRRLTFSKKNSEKIKFSFFDAYTGEDKEFQKLFENSDIYEHAETYDIGSVIGCARSHFELWKYVIQKNSPVLILEDDAIFMDERAQIFFNQATVEGFDVLFLDGQLVEEEYELQTPYPHHSGTAYVMTPSGAKKLVEKIENEGFGSALDWEIVNMQSRGLKCMCFNRVVIVPDASEKSQLRKLETRNELPQLVKLLKLNGRGAEIGVGDGAFSHRLIRDAEFSEFYSIDSWSEIAPDTFYSDGRSFLNTWCEICYAKTKETLQEFGERSKILRELSHVAADAFSDEFFDFIYIDADHREEAVRIDIDSWYPKLRKGGMLAGHDYMDSKMEWEGGIYSLFGVKTAVDDFVAKNDLNLIVIEEKDWAPWHSWAFIKK